MESQSSPLQPRPTDAALSPWVRIPVDHPGYRDTGRGSLVVKLAIESRGLNIGALSPLFAGPYSSAVIDPNCEHLISDLAWTVSDDQPLSSPVGYSAGTGHSLKNMLEHYSAWLRREFSDLPSAQFVEPRQPSQETQIAVLTLADINWVGCYRETNTFWSCNYQLLTLRGKQLYDHLGALYPGATIRLITLLRQM